MNRDSLSSEELTKYDSTLESYAKQYGKEIKTLLRKIRDSFREYGMIATNPHYYNGDNHEWGIVVREKYTRREDSASIRFTIAESLDYGDSVEYEDSTEVPGITFRVDFVGCGGRILGGMCPYNYSSRVWVPFSEKDEVAERFSLFRNIEGYDLIKLWEDR